MISNQICCFKNSKKLIEFNDKLKPAAPSEYGHMYAGFEEKEKKQYSNIGVKILDYSGEVTKTVTFNLSPWDVKQLYREVRRVNDRTQDYKNFAFLFNKIACLIVMVFNFVKHVDQVLMGMWRLLHRIISRDPDDVEPFPELPLTPVPLKNVYEVQTFNVFSAQKLIAAIKDEETGLSPMSSITINKVLYDKQGNPRNSPWQITIDNGEAKAKVLDTGATMAESNSYKSKEKLSVFLTDREIEILLRQVCDFMQVFEMTECFKSIRKGREQWKNYPKEGNEC